MVRFRSLLPLFESVLRPPKSRPFRRTFSIANSFLNVLLKLHLGIPCPYRKDHLIVTLVPRKSSGFLTTTLGLRTGNWGTLWLCDI